MKKSQISWGNFFWSGILTFLGTWYVIGTTELEVSCSNLLTSPSITVTARLGIKQAPFVCSPVCRRPSTKNGSFSVTSWYAIVISPFPAKNSIFVSLSKSGINMPVEESSSKIFSGVSKLRKSLIMTWRIRQASKPVVKILFWDPSHTTLESLILWWLSAVWTIGELFLGSIIRTHLSLQLVARIVPSCFQLKDWITSGWLSSSSKNYFKFVRNEWYEKLHTNTH